VQKILSQIKSELTDELTQNILPFWINKMTDEKNGGFYGQINGKNQLVPDAPKGGILNARILWTFSSAALHLKNPFYLKTAERAKNYIFSHFFDTEYGGTYWMLHADGTPADTKKQIYSQAFFIYALTEYYRASKDKECLNKAVELFHLIEKYSFDREQNGYFEVYSREWKLLDDLRLSEKDANEKKTMNTHLHILEAYTNLYRVWKDERLKNQLQNLIDIFLTKIINRETYHLDLFFDENWNCKSTIFSYGHDIESAWLLEEAAKVLGNEDLLTKVKSETLKVTEAAAEGIRTNGGLINEKNYLTGHVNSNFDWWPQAEAMVGFFNAYQNTRNEDYTLKTIAIWNFIKHNIIDSKNGEWFWSVSESGIKNTSDDKAGFWKCPYHNSRMCLELLERIEKVVSERNIFGRIN
jgi:mannobiose 2-epimerase